MMDGSRHIVTSATLNGARGFLPDGHHTTSGPEGSVKISAASVKIAAPSLSRVLSARGSRPVLLPPVRLLAAGACSARAFVPAAFFWGEA
jgi:hypothetical protein